MPWDLAFFGAGTDVYHIVQWFFIYSILGWIVETIYMSICGRRFVNRGFIFGPICPIYGFGALIAYFLLRPLADNLVLLYLAGGIMATAWEFLVAKVMMAVFGEVWWDYSEKPFNYKGILCLESSVAWGFYVIILFTFLHKFVMFLSDLYPYQTGCILGGVLMVYYLVDFTVHLCKAKFPEVPDKARRIKNKFVSFCRS